MDIETHLIPRLLRDADAMSMARSLELRPIFLDHELVERVLALPAPMRLRKKRLLLDAVNGWMPEGLNEDLRTRPKRTFTLPFAKWISSGLSERIAETFSSERLKAVGLLDASAVQGLWKKYLRAPASVGWSRIWSLFVLQRWCETMQVRP